MKKLCVCCRRCIKRHGFSTIKQKNKFGGVAAGLVGAAVMPVAIFGGVVAGIGWLIKFGIDKAKE